MNFCAEPAVGVTCFVVDGLVIKSDGNNLSLLSYHNSVVPCALPRDKDGEQRYEHPRIEISKSLMVTDQVIASHIQTVSNYGFIAVSLR